MRRSTSDKPSLSVLAVAGVKTSERSRSLPLSSNSPFVNSPVSSPGSGGGPSGRSVGAAPDTPVITTPPRPSLGETDPFNGECSCDCQTKQNLYTFSAKTCRELLKSNVLSEKQLDYERQNMKRLGINVDTKTRITSCKNKIIAALEKELNYHNCIDQENTVKQLNSLTSYVSCAAQEVEMIRRRVLPTPPATAQRLDLEDLADHIRHPSPAPAPTDSIEEVKLDDEVCHIFDKSRLDFSDLHVDTILEELVVDTPATHGNRLVAYYGNTPYRYGAVKHDPSPYPVGGVFDLIFTRMQAVMPDFTPSNYTCLVTLYPNGSAHIKPQSDNEGQIQSDTSIYTVSIGSERSISFQNQVGVINETSITIPHGSVFGMSRSSQVMWKHSIPADPTVTNPRISFTFRKLIPESEVPKPTPAPPICHPDEYVSPQSPPRGTHAGILLLTDSILSHTPEHIFDKIPGHRLIKKVNKRLTDVMAFEPEFRYRNMVVFSCGVNDLSCYGLRGHVLADIMCPRIAEAAKNHPNTTFVFNSLLYTRHSWLNEEIDVLNKLMFELSLVTRNFVFFDSSDVISDNPISASWDNVIEPRDPRRLHITRAARVIITDSLVRGLDLLSRRAVGKPLPTTLRNWKWPLRREFVNALPRLRENLGNRAVSHNLTCIT